MKENNNIAIALDALGEKIAALELELQCEKYRNAEMEKQLIEKDAEITKLKCELNVLIAAGRDLVEGR